MTLPFGTLLKTPFFKHYVAGTRTVVRRYCFRFGDYPTGTRKKLSASRLNERIALLPPVKIEVSEKVRYWTNGCASGARRLIRRGICSTATVRAA